MSAQVDEVAAFVANNARRVLGVDAAQVLPVSARAALDAKLAFTKDKRGFFGEQQKSCCIEVMNRAKGSCAAITNAHAILCPYDIFVSGVLDDCAYGKIHVCHCAGSEAMPMLDEQGLARNEHWQRSRFGKLEQFMVDFLVGGASAGESLRLKLQTPLFVSDALLEAARQQLEAERAAAEQVASEEFATLSGIVSYPRMSMHIHICLITEIVIARACNPCPACHSTATWA